MEYDEQRKRDLGFRREIEHNNNRRAFCHNYDAPGTYLVTVTVVGRRPLLGSLVGGENPYIMLSELGRMFAGMVAVDR